MLLFVASALAAELILESQPLDTRAEAQALRRSAEEQGLEARLVRRYQSGSGWEYVVVVEGLEDEDAAQAAAEAWAAASEEGISILGGQEPAVVAEPPAAEPTGPSSDLPQAELVLRHAVRALGGVDGGRAALERAPAIRFAYVREVAAEGDRIEAHHELLRSADGQRLVVTSIDGAVDSATLVHPEGAWLVVSGETLEQDRERATDVLADFGPEQLLGYPLDFASLVAEEPAYGRLRTTAERDGAYLLEYGGPEVGGSMRLEVEALGWHPRSVSYATEAGEVRYHFADWRELDTGLVVPFEVELHRDGALVDRLVVDELSLMEALAEGSLELP